MNSLSADISSLKSTSEAPAGKALLTGAEVVVQTLKRLGVEVIFGYPGGAVLPIYDALFQDGSIEHILVRHEQAALHAAEGYARSTGKVGTVLVTSGPGATNAVTGLADALLDSIPLVCLTGQVARHLIGNDAFQEADTVGITRPCTKHNYLVKKTSKLESIIEDAYRIASTGRPGPVVVDIPKDVQVDTTRLHGSKSETTLRPHRGYRVPEQAPTEQVKKAVDVLLGARRPIFYVGGGVISAGQKACDSLRELVEKTGAPITTTLMGLGAFPAGHAQDLGMLGMHGTFEANHAMHDCDVMVAVGVRFDDRVTGRIDGFSPDSFKIQVDVDRSSVNKNVMVDLALLGDAGLVLDQLLAELEDRSQKLAYLKKHQQDWWIRIAGWRARKCLDFTPSETEILPQHLLSRLEALTRDKNRVIATEVGQHQMWAAQYLGFHKAGRWLTSGGLGTMGYGLPAAIGAQIAYPDALVIDVAGDASIQMNIQELGTIKQYGLPVKVLIMNNAFMGMVRQWQDLNFEGRRAHSYSEALPDFVALAEAYGLKGLLLSDPAKIDETLTEMIEFPGAVIVDCRIAKLENVFPMVPAGAAHNEMLLADDTQTNGAPAASGPVDMSAV